MVDRCVTIQNSYIKQVYGYSGYFVTWGNGTRVYPPCDVQTLLGNSALFLHMSVHHIRLQ